MDLLYILRAGSSSILSRTPERGLKSNAKLPGKLWADLWRPAVLRVSQPVQQIAMRKSEMGRATENSNKALPA